MLKIVTKYVMKSILILDRLYRYPASGLQMEMINLLKGRNGSNCSIPTLKCNQNPIKH